MARTTQAGIPKDNQYDLSLSAQDLETIRLGASTLVDGFSAFLTWRDVALLTLEATYAAFRRAYLPRGQRWVDENDDHLADPAFNAVLRACPGLLERAGLVPVQPCSPEYASRFVVEAWFSARRELAEIVRRFMGSPKRAVSPREFALLRTWKSICQMQVGSRKELLGDLRAGVRLATRGNPDHDDVREENLRAELLVLAADEDFARRFVFIGRDGRRRIGKTQVRVHWESEHGPSVAASLDAGGRDDESASLRDSLKSTTEPDPGASASVLEELGRARVASQEVRLERLLEPVLDLIDHEAGRSPELASMKAGEVIRLVKLVGAEPDPGLKAELIFQWARQGHHTGFLTREAVHKTLRVSIRTMRRREAEARERLRAAGLLAAA